jgi:predicted MPP superfamily phosphohydrolase
MLFLLIILLILLSELIFAGTLLSTDNSILNLIAYLQLVLFWSSFLLIFKFFRQRSQQTNYKKGFYLFGLMILTGVPTLGFFIPGVLHNITQIEEYKWIGLIIAFLLLTSLIIGIFWGRWNWKVHRIELEFPHLPESFHNIKLVQISDVHIGSFFENHNKVKKAIQKINDLEADYFFFTGDLVNNTADEMQGWEPIFREIQAKKGKFSILGNHDYGDYVRWENQEQKRDNLIQLIDSHREIGFTPLLNKAVELTDGFWLLGVENWGKAPFRQSGKLDETLKNIPNEHFKLLLSHDPSHFDEQVIHTNIDLTLSGHTHGMQFGIERFGIKWSPVSFRYKKWGGLYKKGNQYLYVNRGFGYIGFPGRVGIYPEITEIVLKKK